MAEDILSKSFEQALSAEEQTRFKGLYDEVLADYRRSLRIARAQRELGLEYVRKPVTYPPSTFRDAQEKWIPTNDKRETYLLSIEHKQQFDPRKKFVSVLLPCNSGGGDIFSSARELVSDLKALGNDFEFELNFCLNNSRDETFDRVMKFRNLFPEVPINVYEFDLERLGGVGKIFALNVLYGMKKVAADERKKSNPDAKYYLHVADDDIGYPKPGGIKSNISLLESEPQLKVTSGTDSTTRTASGFQFLNAIRKSPQVLRCVHPLPQVYGAAMTMDIENVPQGGFPEGTAFDVVASLHWFNEFLSKPLPDEVDYGRLPLHSNPGFMFEHRVEPSYLRFFSRLVRDVEFRKRGVESAFGNRPIEELSDIERRFIEFRERGYDCVSQAVEDYDGPNSELIKAGHRWIGRMRDDIRACVDQGTLQYSDFQDRRVAALVDHPPLLEQEFVHALSKNRGKVESIGLALRMNGCLTQKEMEEISKPEKTEKEIIKMMETVIERNRERIEKEEYFHHPGLLLLSEVQKSAFAARINVTKPEMVGQVFQSAGLPLTGTPSMREVGEGNTNLVYFVKGEGENEKYFYRYHDPLGRQWMQANSPRKVGYIYTLAEELTRELIGPDQTVRTLYPHLDEASRNYFSREEENDPERIAQRVLIQEDLSDSYLPLSEYKQLGLSFSQATACRAGILGRYHAKSYGAVRYYNQDLHQEHKVMRLLNLAGDDIRIPDAENYRNWLNNPQNPRPNWFTHIFQSLEGEYYQDNRVYQPVKKEMESRGIDIHSRFDAVCDESIAQFAENGVIGRGDHNFHNIFAGKNDPQNDLLLFDFDHVSFIDPMYEVGQSLSSALLNGIAQGRISDLKSYEEVKKTFNEAYYSEFNQVMQQGNFAGDSFAPSNQQMKDRSDFFAGFIFLMRAATGFERYGFDEKQIDLVNGICIDLMTPAKG